MADRAQLLAEEGDSVGATRKGLRDGREPWPHQSPPQSSRVIVATEHPCELTSLSRCRCSAGRARAGCRIGPQARRGNTSPIRRDGRPTDAPCRFPQRIDRLPHLSSRGINQILSELFHRDTRQSGRPRHQQEGNTIDISAIAQVCHEANRAIQIVTNDPAPSPAWDDAPEWQRASAIEGVQKALDGETAEQLHESWCAFKENDGWIWGELKDVDAKTHPCLIEYESLPPEQRAKDHVFAAIVAALDDGSRKE